MTKIYYVGARLLHEDSVLLGSSKRLHATIVYSQNWFPYKPPKVDYPIVIYPAFYLDEFNGIPVLRFHSSELEARHKELKKVGATWDYDEFKPHISLPKGIVVLPRRLCLEYEYYMTWEQ